MLNKKIILILFILFIAIGTVSAVAASDANNGTVSDSSYNKMEGDNSNNIVEEGVDGTSNPITAASSDDNESYSSPASDDTLQAGSTQSFKQLQTYINTASAGGTITLTSDYRWVKDTDSDQITINKPLTIKGNGHTIWCSDSGGIKHSRAFNVLSDGVVFNDLTIIDGYYYIGGAVYIECAKGGQTTFNNCKFINNTGPNMGGAIFTNAELIINKCTFNNNRAEAYDYLQNNGPIGYGGAIYAAFPSEGYKSVTITDSVFENNRASAQGGAIYLDFATYDGYVKNFTAHSQISNTQFNKNIATYGGAIANNQYLDVKDSKFSENKAQGSGGAIFEVNGVLFSSKNGPIFQVFALEVHGTSSFIKNTATAGGAISFSNHSDYPLPINGLLSIYDNVLFDSNSASGNGGALHIYESLSTVRDAQFKNNKANNQGSSMYGGTAVDCTFDGNPTVVTSLANLVNTGYTRLDFSQAGTYYNDKTVTVKLTNSKYNTPLRNIRVNVKFSNGKSVTLTTNSNGVATYKVPFSPGTYDATVTISESYISMTQQFTGIKITKAPITITPTKLSTTYASEKNFQVKVINSKTGKVVTGLKLKLKVYTGSSYKTVAVTTDSKGIAKYTGASTLAVGTHKVIASNSQTKDCSGSQKTSSIVISKASYNIIAPKVTNPYKVGEFKITVKNKASGKGVSGVALTVKIYTGSKFNTYSGKTNSKGIAVLSTKALSKGTHKIVVSTKATKNYKAASKSSSANIVTKAKTTIGYVDDIVFYVDKNWVTSNSFYTVTRVIGLNVVLKDANGNPITKTVKLSHSNGNFTKDSSGKLIFVYGGRPGTLTIKFAGDSHYLASSKTIKLGDEQLQHV